MLPNFILSPCGTSLLTNGASADERSRLSQYANALENQIPAAEKAVLSKRIETVRERLLRSSPQEVVTLSAELNAIVRYYGYRIDHKRDFHVLLTTDTWLGRTTGELVKSWLQQYGMSITVYTQPDLQTKELNRFQLALSDLVVWCEKNIPSGYHVVFNLTGGFKSIQGFLQTLAIFYADEAIYVFESGTELLRLPRLPVRIAADQVLEKQFPTLRKINHGIKTNASDDSLALLVLQIGDDIALSQYGQIIFQQLKNDFYSKKIYPPVLDQIRFGPKFMKSVEKIDRQRER